MDLSRPPQKGRDRAGGPGPRRFRLGVTGSGLGLALGFGLMMAGSVAASTPPSCEAFAARAGAAAGVPEGLMPAISRTETGHSHKQYGYGAWPWTLNIHGRGYYFETREAALAKLRASIAAGKTSVDVGCMQINYRWHGDQFNSLEEMFDPDINTAYAAKFLTTLQRRHGSWNAATRHYHSSDTERGSAYLARVEEQRQSLPSGSGAAPVDRVVVAASPPPVTIRMRPRALMAIAGTSLLGGGTPLVPQSGHKAILSTETPNALSAPDSERQSARMASLREAFGLTQ